MKKESFGNSRKYSVMAEQMIKMSQDCPEITKMILNIVYGDEIILQNGKDLKIGD